MLDIKKEKSNINNKLNYYFIFDFIGCNPGGHRIFAGEQSGTSCCGGAFSGNGTGYRPSH